MKALEVIRPYLEDEHVLIGLTAATAGLIVKLLSRRKPRRPPGPTVWPVVGSLPSMKDDISIFSELAKKYGDIYYLQLGLFGYQPTIVLSNIDLIRESLLKKQDDFAGRYHTSSTDIFSDNGADILFGDFTPEWRLQRKIAHAALRKYASGEHLQELLEHCVDIVSDLFRKLNGEPVDTFDIVSLLFYNIIASMCFGKKFELDDPEFLRIKGMIDDINDQFTGFPLADLLPILKHIPTPFQRLIKKHMHAIRDYLAGIYNEHRDNFDENDVRDLTYLLIQINNETKGRIFENEEAELENKHFIQIMSDMFFAGTDTSRLTLHWALLFLAAHPEVQERAQKEIDEELGRDSRITTTNRVKIPYCEAIIYETMRLRSPAPIAVPHATTCDTTVGGYEVPKGTQVLINLAHLHLDPKTWKNPEEFHPERFIDEHGNLAPKPDSFLPFSTGRRQCVGEALAKTELHVIMGKLLQRFSFISSPGKKVDLTPKQSLFVYLPKENKIIVKER